MTPFPAHPKLRLRLVGVVFLVVFALLVWLSLSLYNKAFTPVATVTLYTDSVGNEMHPGAEVMVRGVQVGQVRQISAYGTGARLTLAIQPGMVSRLPANLTAEMVPATLFGERYVDLIMPARPVPQRLTAGSVIRQDRSHDAIELEKVLNNLLPLLRASEPDELSVFLTSLAQGLQGKGMELGQTLVAQNAYLQQYNKHLPALDNDIKGLVGLFNTLHRASPDLVQALADFTVTSQTIVAERANLSALYTTLTSAAGDLRAFLDANSPNIIKLSADSVPSLRILARYSPEFPCVLKDLVKFEPAANKLLGKGTGQPGLHAQVVILPPLGPGHIGHYVFRRDTPIYGDNLGPHCYPIPFPGITLNDGAAPSSPATTASVSGSPGPAAHTTAVPVAGSALAGSPLEGELVRELTGLALRRPPAMVPSWGSLLTAPLFRGATVRVR